MPKKPKLETVKEEPVKKERKKKVVKEPTKEDIEKLNKLIISNKKEADEDLRLLENEYKAMKGLGLTFINELVEDEIGILREDIESAETYLKSVEDSKKEEQNLIKLEKVETI